MRCSIDRGGPRPAALLFALALLTALGCEAAALPPEAPPCDPEDQLSWENVGAPFVHTWCTGCHAVGVPAGQRQGAPLAVNLDQLAFIRIGAAEVWHRAAGPAPSMPPGGGPSAEERALFGRWLACGAPRRAELSDQRGPQGAGQRSYGP